MEVELNNQITTLLQPFGKLRDLQKLFGEASYRIYFRAVTEDGQSYVVMKLPAGRQSASEEITNYQGPKDEIPFLNIQQYLISRGLPVPRVLAKDLSQGLILLQDLGDKTLEKLLVNCNDPMRLFFYKQAIDLLLKLQKAGEEPDKACMAFQRSFDPRLFSWEFDHFLEFGIEDRLSVKIPDEERNQIQAAALPLLKSLTEIPYGLTHRDFQSRNLLLYEYQLYLIDFQDALMGPPQYDLVALLRDSYVELPLATVNELLDYYFLGRKEVGLPEVNLEDFLKGFHRVTLQRKLKDAGRFQYIHKVKGNPNFLPHLPTSLRYVQQAFAELPEYRGLQEMLGKYVPELL